MAAEITMDNIYSVITTPAIRALQRANITSIGKLLDYSEEELRALDGIGETCMKHINTVLHQHDLKLKGQENKIPNR